MNPAEADHEGLGRLQALVDLSVLDTEAESPFDGIAAVTKSAFAAQATMVGFLDEERHWFKAKTGVEISESPRSISFCTHAIRQDDVLWVADAREDPRFRDGPLVAPGGPEIRFYGGAPIIVSGHRVGTVCVLDRAPRAYDPALAAVLADLARMAADQLELRKLRLIEAEARSETRRAREAAEAANRAKSQFLANMSHEVRTPLNGVLGLAAVLESTSLDRDQTAMVQMIEQSGRDLEHLLTGMLDLVRLDGEAVEASREPLDLIGLVEAAAAGCAEAARAKGLEVRVRADGGSAPACFGDPVLIGRVLAQLAENAVKFTDTGWVNFTLDLSPQADRVRARIHVQDTGIGFAQADAEALFQRFHQADDANTRRHGGSGLGLSVCRALAETMGGTVEARALPEGGSVFTLALDLERRAPALNAAA